MIGPLEHVPGTERVPLDVDGSLDEMRRREQAWYDRNDPRSLWPGLQLSALQPAADDIGRAAARMLRGEHATLGAGAEHDTRALGVAALLSGTGPLLGYWVERGLLDVPDDVARLLAEHLAHGRQRADRVARGMTPLLARLADAGITPVAIKGFHTSREYFPEPGTRPFGDVDLVVRPEEIPRAVEQLRELGFVSDRDVPGPYKRNWSAPDDPDSRNASFERWDARTRWKLELHTGLQFANLQECGVVLDMDWRAMQPATPDASYRVLPQPLLLVALAIHASGELYSMRLLRLIEQAYVIRQDLEAGRLDWTAVEELLLRTRTLRFAYPVFALVEQLAPGTIDARVLRRSRRASTRRALEITARFTPTSPILSQHVSIKERLMWSDSPWRTAKRLLVMVLPAANQPWPMVLRVYRQRITRVLAGKLVIGSSPALPHDVKR
jgi:putative nucleotidyltransferase-like protein